MEKYRGTIAYDEPSRSLHRSYDGPTRETSLNYLEWKRGWRARNKEHLRLYNLEYQRRYRAKKELKS